MNRKDWARIHTHIHTVHSDGGNSLLEMAKAHRDRGFDAFYVTDHNTMSAMAEAREVFEETGVTVLAAVEYTTFHGHILSYGEYLEDWTLLDPESMEAFLHRHKEQGSLSAIAHYHCVGYPLCTGCRFEFDGPLTDHEKLKSFDMMEVWHGDRMHWEENHRLWLELLNRGHRITALAGLDAHRSDEVRNNPIGNFVRLDGKLPLEESIARSMVKGDLVMSLGDLLDFRLRTDGAEGSMGDCLDRKVLSGESTLDISCRVSIRGMEDSPGGTHLLKVVTNRGVSCVCSFTHGETDDSGDISFSLALKDLQGGWEDLAWLYVELIQEDYFSRSTRAVCNPLYFS